MYMYFAACSIVNKLEFRNFAKDINKYRIVKVGLNL